MVNSNLFPFPPEIVDIIIIYIGRADLAYALDKLSLMKYFLPNDFCEAMGPNETCLNEKFGVDFNSCPNLIDWTAATGRLRYLRYLTENTESFGTKNAMDSASFYGLLNVEKYLHFSRFEGCTTRAMDIAALRGNLDILKFLHENRSEGCTTDAMDNAAAHGHLEIIRFLDEHRTEGCTAYAMEDAAANGHFEAVEYLHNHRSEGYEGCEVVHKTTTEHLKKGFIILRLVQLFICI